MVAARRDIAADVPVAPVNGGPVAAEPKMHFSPKLLHKGLKPENTDVPGAGTDPNGTKRVSHTNMPMGLPKLRAVARQRSKEGPHAASLLVPDLL